MEEIFNAIPQRPPFLFVDKIIEKSKESIQTQKKLTGEEDFFKGHFPGNPIMPGVLLQEALFQTGAILIGDSSGAGSLGVVTKVENARFKSLVSPQDTLDIYVSLVDQLENAFYMKGHIKVNGKKVMSAAFTCALIPSSPSKN